jgi:short subunit dehydrogenase-like uncharacterized protein
MPDRELDLVLVGATGFVGALTAAHLARAGTGRRIALAGRSPERLAALRDGLGEAAADWPLIVVDAHDSAGLRALAERTRVVATTVGPYLRLGLPLAAACAHAGTHYADLTGEVLFVRRSADMLHEVAQRTGARIVHSCGFDSVPSDLGVLLTAQRARDELAGNLTATTLYVRSLNGGFSGGTIDSARQSAIEAAGDPWARKTLTDPYALSPDRSREPRGPGERDSRGPLGTVLAPISSALNIERERTTGHWLGPFVMAPFNTRIVRRSNALLGWGYGRGFRYREVLDLGTAPTAPFVGAGWTVGTGALYAAFTKDTTRALVDRMLPKPGEGPAAEDRRRGRFRVEVVARTVTGSSYRTVVGADLDPGYDGTAVMFGQAALALACDDLPQMAGVLTPATGIGAGLAERLRAHDFTVTTTRVR